MAYSVKHTQIGAQPHWYLLERWDEAHRQKAIRRASEYALDHGGYVCVTDNDGKVVFGTDPAALDDAIAKGINKHFPRPAAMHG